MSIVDLLKHVLLDLHASWVMWILLSLSVVNAVLIVERALFLRASRDDVGRLSETLDRLLRAGQVREAMEAMRASPAPEAAVVVAGLRSADMGPAAAEKAMLGAVALQRLRLERGLAVLGTVGNNAPFLGLLGTVIGIVEAFEILGRPVAAGASALAPAGIMSSIAEALVATAVGLFVAIPAVAAFNYFQRRIQSVVANTEALTNVLLAHLLAEVPPDTQPTHASAQVR